MSLGSLIFCLQFHQVWIGYSHLWLQSMGTEWKCSNLTLTMTFWTQRALNLSSKCYDWITFNKAYCSWCLHLTWLEHGPHPISLRWWCSQPALCALVLSSLSFHMALTADALSESRWLVPKRPMETLVHVSLLCLKIYNMTQNQPRLLNYTCIFLIVCLELIMTKKDWWGVSTVSLVVQYWTSVWFYTFHVCSRDQLN